jgi:ribosome biogenesis GTPase
MPDDLRAELSDYGWDDQFQHHYEALGAATPPRRVARLDRGWSTLLPTTDAIGATVDGDRIDRARNIGADVAVGDWVVPSGDGARIEFVLPRRSALVRRASFAGARGASQTVAANVDVVCVLHAMTSPANPRRLERELVLAFDSGARPVVLLTKADAVDDPEAMAAEVAPVALDVPVIAVSSRRGDGLDDVLNLASGGNTLALLGASGVGKSTLVNRLVGRAVQRTADVRSGDDRGRHTTTAAELVRLPGSGWLIDTPGLRAVSLWSSGHGIERAFADVFALTDHCRFRDCKHEDEPGCAVNAAIAAGALDVDRVAAMKRLVAEEAALEAEQRAKERAADRRGVRRPRRP